MLTEDKMFDPKEIDLMLEKLQQGHSNRVPLSALPTLKIKHLEAIFKYSELGYSLETQAQILSNIDSDDFSNLGRHLSETLDLGIKNYGITNRHAQIQNDWIYFSSAALFCHTIGLPLKVVLAEAYVNKSVWGYFVPELPGPPMDTRAQLLEYLFGFSKNFSSRAGCKHDEVIELWGVSLPLK